MFAHSCSSPKVLHRLLIKLYTTRHPNTRVFSLQNGKFIVDQVPRKNLRIKTNCMGHDRLKISFYYERKIGTVYINH